MTVKSVFVLYSMKKIISALILLSFLAVPVIGLAACSSYTTPTTCLEKAEEEGCYWVRDVNDATGITGECKSGGVSKSDVMRTLQNIINWLFVILLVVAVIFIVIGGLMYVTAQGDPEKVKKASQYVLYALIGVIVALLARGLVTLVQKFMV